MTIQENRALLLLLRLRPGSGTSSLIEAREVVAEHEESPEGPDTGESEALILAETFRPDVLLLVDDEAGRQEARRRQIRVTGTLGVLGDAAARELADLESAIQGLRNTNFRVTDGLLQQFMARSRHSRRT